MAGKQRERALARQRAMRRASRIADRRARARRRNTTIAAVTAGLVALGGLVYAGVSLSSGGHHSPTAAASPSASASPTPSPTPSAAAGMAQCLYTKPASGSAKPAKPGIGIPLPFAPNTHDYAATITTNRGTISALLYGKKAPCAANSMSYLAAHHYFDSTPCHRLTTSGIYVLQCGDPTGTGTGGPGYAFQDENLNAFGTGAQVSYPAGTLAMANSGANTNGSQFFIVYKASPLAPSYTPFGRITAGLSVVLKVAAAGSTPALDGSPKEKVTIDALTVRPLA